MSPDPVTVAQLDSIAARAVLETLLMVIAHKQPGSAEILTRLAEMTLERVDQYELRGDASVEPEIREALRQRIADIFREPIAKSWKG